MKNTIIKTLSMLGICLAMGVNVIAQEAPKAKETAKEAKYKSDYVKTKDEKDSKSKTADMKIKDERKEGKKKGVISPMHVTATERSELRTGETNVQVQEHLTPVTTTTVVSEPVIPEPVTAPVPQPVSLKSTAPRKTIHRRVAAVRRPNTGVRYVVRTKLVRDTVFVPSPPERIVSTETQYLHDTVNVTRVDTVVRMQTVNTYTGYSVPRGNFKKVILTKDKKTGEVTMKKKTDNR